MKILKVLLVVILTLLSIGSIYYLFSEGGAGRLTNWITILIPMFFILVILKRNKILWLISILVVIWAIVDVFYYGSYSATAPTMEFTRMISENTEISWIKRPLNIFSVLFYPIVLIVLLLPSVRKKYLNHD